MPTDFFLRSVASGLGGAGQLGLSQRRGRGNLTATTTTTSSGTNIAVTTTAGGQTLTWFSEPITEAITISSAVTVRIRGRESATAVNAGRGILIERTDSAGAVLSAIVADTTVPATIAEFTTTDAANGTATYAPTNTAMAVGDRIKVTLKIRNVGTMGPGTAAITYDGAALNASGDTFITFTENIRTNEVLDVPHFEVFGSNGYRG